MLIWVKILAMQLSQIGGDNKIENNNIAMYDLQLCFISIAFIKMAKTDMLPSKKELKEWYDRWYIRFMRRDTE